MATAESVVRPRPQVLSDAERRTHLRAHLDAPVLVDARCAWQRASGTNVSEGGVALACDAPLPVGATVDVYFELPSGVAVEAQARVLRSTEVSAALAFVALDRRSLVALRHHCRAPWAGTRPPASR